MSRASRRRAGTSRAGASPAPRHGAARSRHVAVLAATATVMAAAAVLLLPRGAPPPRAVPEARAFPDSIARLDPDSAYQRGFYLDRAGHPEAALPYLRYALTRPSQPALELVGYSDVLHNHALEQRVRAGVPMPAVRSSYERVALMRESFARLAAAERAAEGPGDRALVDLTRAHHLLIWGLPLDALTAYRAALAVRPSLAGEVAGLEWQLQHPARGAAPAPHP